MSAKHHLNCAYNGYTREHADRLLASGGITKLGYEVIIERITHGCHSGCLIVGSEARTTQYQEDSDSASSGDLSPVSVDLSPASGASTSEASA